MIYRKFYETFVLSDDINKVSLLTKAHSVQRLSVTSKFPVQEYLAVSPDTSDACHLGS